MVTPRHTADRAPPSGALELDAAFADNDTAVIPTPPQTPRANAFAERWTRTAHTEGTGRLLITGERHLRTVLTRYAQHSNAGRPHRSLSCLTARSRVRSAAAAATRAAHTRLMPGPPAPARTWRASAACDPRGARLRST
ncbi:integrase core domain-containing protein [Streptomyces malaysiensis]|uniref:integrase core domain-containing protein n=1 Tax=Streptomyces malaysiensis TaxID=92644 RepID=UPI001FCC2E1F|nr:integrase core domain-containing protein [Streptomyces malaysiensis]